jgi:hypothetical protein
VIFIALAGAGTPGADGAGFVEALKTWRLVVPDDRVLQDSVSGRLAFLFGIAAVKKGRELARRGEAPGPIAGVHAGPLDDVPH